MQELARVGDVVERYYDQFYRVDESGKMEDHYIHLHVNGLCVVRLTRLRVFSTCLREFRR